MWWQALWPIALVFGVVLWLLVGLLPGARRRFSRKWISAQGAPITTPLTREVEESRWRQRRGGDLGALVGLVVVTVVTVRSGSVDSDRGLLISLAVWIVPIILVFVGRGVIGTVSAMREAWGPDEARQAARVAIEGV